MFDADRPITKSDQDRLDRSPFAKNLARCLLDHRDPDSLVVGLYGGWGAGKTSIVNLTIEELNFASSNMLDEDKPIILNFSPWSYSGQNQLIYSFFRRLSSSLRRAEYLDDAHEIIYLLELYVSFFTQKPVPTSLRIKPDFKSRFLKKSDTDVGWESGQDLTLVKGQLIELLRRQKHKIIIIIDNISRLYDYEIKQIFQIVKSMGDFPNTIYLLVLDKKQVINALNRLEGYGGKDLLDKIIQLPFEVPPILQQDLEKIFADRLNEVMPFVPEDAWETEHWANIYYGGLKYFFENCRDITRYVNILNFSYPRVRDVVNPVDYFVLTALEVFLPSVYAGIRDNKDLFTDLLDNVYRLDTEQIKLDKIRCDEILKRFERLPKKMILAILMELFPRIRKIYQPAIIFYHSDATARKLKRICSPDLFDVYFRLSLQFGKIPEDEFDTILRLSKDVNAFDQALTRLNQDDRILQFLDMLDSQVLYDIPEENITPIVSALLDDGDLFPVGIKGRLSLDTPMRIHRIIHSLLQRISSVENRFIILQQAIARSNKSLYIIVHELRMQAREHSDQSDTFVPLEFRDLLPEQLASLQGLTVIRIQNWAKNGSLATHPQILPILSAWLEWGDPFECQAFVNELVATDTGLLAFLNAIFNEAVTQAMQEYVKTALWEKCLRDIEVFIEPSALEAHAKKLFESDQFERFPERSQLALMIFLDLMKTDTRKIIPKTTV